MPFSVIKVESGNLNLKCCILKIWCSMLQNINPLVCHNANCWSAKTSSPGSSFSRIQISVAHPGEFSEQAVRHGVVGFGFIFLGSAIGLSDAKGRIIVSFGLDFLLFKMKTIKFACLCIFLL